MTERYRDSEIGFKYSSQFDIAPAQVDGVSCDASPGVDDPWDDYADGGESASDRVIGRRSRKRTSEFADCLHDGNRPVLNGCGRASHEQHLARGSDQLTFDRCPADVDSCHDRLAVTHVIHRSEARPIS
jgi:hypothetical protein